MELAKNFIDVPQTERGGEMAQKGFDFLACWALSHMFEYELQGKEYVFFNIMTTYLFLTLKNFHKKLRFRKLKLMINLGN